MRTTPLLAVLLALCLSSCSAADQPPSDDADGNLSAASSNDAASSSDESKMWVTVQRIDRHTCPSVSCGVVGTLSFREAATVEERKGDWARVSRFYDASCVGGRSEFVDKGNASCTSENGIVEGKFAEWVEAKNLSATRPADPAETASADEQLVKDSDDFTQHRQAFVTAARSLIDRGECTAGDLQENGGFMKSTTNYRDEPVYFTYCGGYTVANRVYVNVSTGEIFR